MGREMVLPLTRWIWRVRQFEKREVEVGEVEETKEARRITIRKVAVMRRTRLK